MGIGRPSFATLGIPAPLLLTRGGRALAAASLRDGASNLLAHHALVVEGLCLGATVTLLFVVFGLSRRAKALREATAKSHALALVAAEDARRAQEQAADALRAEVERQARDLAELREQAAKRAELDAVMREEAAAAAAAVAAAASVRATRDSTERRAAPTILVVDDIADLRALLTRTLTRRGFRVVSVEGGRVALEAVRRQPIDLVLTDWTMPEMTGPELILALRRDPTTRSIPAVLLTSKGDEEPRSADAIAVADGVLEKPYTEAELLSVIKNLLALRAKDREIERLNTELAKELQEVIDGLRRQVALRSRELSSLLVRRGSGEKAAPLASGPPFEGRFHIVSELGGGSGGVVYAVERTGDGRRFALKIVTRISSGAEAARFVREAEIASHVRHPAVVSVVDVGLTEAGVPYLVMERVDGGTLEGERPRFGRAPWILMVLRQLAEGLRALHEAGVVHRDLKPSSVLLARHPSTGAILQAKIGDFGVSPPEVESPRIFDAPGPPNSRRKGDGVTGVDSAPPTSPGGATVRGFGGDDVALAAPFYTAPEAARGGGRRASDVFALGIIAFELLTGQYPFASPPACQALLGRDPSEAPPMPSFIAESLRRCVAACLAMDPLARPSAAEVHAMLAAVDPEAVSVVRLLPATVRPTADDDDDDDDDGGVDPPFASKGRHAAFTR